MTAFEAFQPVGAMIRKVDAQGRIALPERVADRLGTVAVVSPGLAGCLELRRPEEWDEYKARFQALDAMHPDATELYRYLIAPAEVVTVDKQLRLRLPEALLRFAGLNGSGKEAQILQMRGCWEVWEAKQYKESAEIRRPALREIASRLFGAPMDGGRSPSDM